MEDSTKKLVEQQVEIKVRELSTWKKVRWEGGRLSYESAIIASEIGIYSVDAQIFYLETLLSKNFTLQDNLPDSAPDITEEFKLWIRKTILKLRFRQNEAKNTIENPNLQPEKSDMKIFISHSSKNGFYGEKLVDLLRNVGIKENEIVFTSNPAYGIPVGENIFDWLKSQIEEKPFVIYLLSEEYYQSVACLNEMGAAWIIENKHAAAFTPDFDLNKKEFQSGALDPREIGFYINDEDRILAFLGLLGKDFEITQNPIFMLQYIRKFVSEVKSYKPETKYEIKKPETEEKFKKEPSTVIAREVLKEAVQKSVATKHTGVFEKFTSSILANKLTDEELLLLHYIIETGRFKLGTGWQTQNEINNITRWEEIHEIDRKLSKNYTEVLQKYEMRGFTEVSDVTSYNNPKELKLKDEISTRLDDLPKDVEDFIADCVQRNYFDYVNAPKPKDDLPF